MPSAGLWGARTRTAPTRGPKLDSCPPGRWKLALKRRKTSLSSRVPARLACPSTSPGHPCPAPAPRCQCPHLGGVPGSRDSRGPTGGPCLGENQREERVPPTTEQRAGRGWGAGVVWLLLAWAKPDHNRGSSRRSSPGLAPGLRWRPPAIGWGAGHWRSGKNSQGNPLIHSRLNAVRPASQGERLALLGVAQVGPRKAVRWQSLDGNKEPSCGF